VDKFVFMILKIFHFKSIFKILDDNHQLIEFNLCKIIIPLFMEMIKDKLGIYQNK